MSSPNLKYKNIILKFLASTTLNLAQWRTVQYSVYSNPFPPADFPSRKFMLRWFSLVILFFQQRYKD